MNLLAKQTTFRLFGRHIRYIADPQVAFFKRSAKPEADNATADVEDNEPIKYFGSKAASWSARQSHHNPNYENSLWYQPFVISASLAVFLIYFCILRDENDVDEKLTMSLYDRIDGLEEAQLVASIRYNQANGLSTTELETRLKEVTQPRT